VDDSPNLIELRREHHDKPPSKHGPVLAALTALFACRVVGQALVAFVGVSWLPAMEYWFSGAIPYPPLLIIQLLMLIVIIKITGEIWRGQGLFAEVRPQWSDFLVKFSAAYAGLMALRYLMGIILYPELRWLGHAIPIFFHFVLAGYIYVLGRYHQVSFSK